MNKEEKVFVLIEYHTPFDNRAPYGEQVSIMVYRTWDAAKAAWDEWNSMRDSPRGEDDYDIIECGVRG